MRVHVRPQLERGRLQMYVHASCINFVCVGYACVIVSARVFVCACWRACVSACV